MHIEVETDYRSLELFTLWRGDAVEDGSAFTLRFVSFFHERYTDRFGHPGRTFGLAVGPHAMLIYWHGFSKDAASKAAPALDPGEVRARVGRLIGI